jgi:CarD family transcriptional regulator
MDCWVMVAFFLLNEGLIMAAKLFSVNDRVVYPGHGVARINRIVEKIIGSDVIHFFELKFLSKEMMVLVPTTNLSSVGIRALSSADYINRVLQKIAQPTTLSAQELTASNWNKRNKEYLTKIRRGDLLELSEIYRELKYIALQKDLSFGEKSLLQQTEALLVEEIAIVEKLGQDKALNLLQGLVTKFPSQPPLTSSVHKHKML